MINDRPSARQADDPRLQREERATHDATGALLRRIDVRDAVVPDTADALDRFFLTGRRVSA
ncbi:hypothetical protein [Streptomyces sp. NPDC001743]|uniref:hypothetical protein n=1 Tax=Streptomyces sp. NPDC001743 TaxID=3154397 RepID=UPI0033236F05